MMKNLDKQALQLGLISAAVSIAIIKLFISFHPSFSDHIGEYTFSWASSKGQDIGVRKLQYFHALIIILAVSAIMFFAGSKWLGKLPETRKLLGTSSLLYLLYVIISGLGYPFCYTHNILLVVVGFAVVHQLWIKVPDVLSLDAITALIMAISLASLGHFSFINDILALCLPIVLVVRKWYPLLLSIIHPRLYAAVSGIVLSMLLPEILGQNDNSVLKGAVFLITTSVLSAWKRSKAFNYLITLVGVTFIATFGIFSEYYPDLFEVANPANSIIRLQQGELPFINYLSSHLLSEQIAPIVHQLTHPNASLLDYKLYEFINPCLYSALTFLFIRKIIKSDAIAFWLLLFFPFISIIFPKEYVFGLLPLLIWLYRSRFPSRSLWYLIWSSVAVGLLWKIDSGISALMATLSLSVILLISKKETAKNILSSGSVLLAIGLVAFAILYFSTSGGIAINLKNTLAYFSADQAHGRPVITNGKMDYLFYLHHAILPLALCINLTRILIFKTLKSISQKEIIIVFLTIFYLSNFQRGLVRHSFASGNDTYLSSFAFLLLSIIIYQVLKTKSKTIALAIIVMLVFTIKFKLPIKRPILYDQFAHQIENTQFQSYQSKEWKHSKAKHISEVAGDLKHVLDTHFNENATFIDMSNRPLLYAITGRTIPSFFNQFLQNTVSEEQQEITIDAFANYNIPLVVYSANPRGWLDRTDGIPNGLRYNLVHDYIRRHYRPLGQLDGSLIWILKGLELQDPLIKPYVHEQWKINLGLSPYYEYKRSNIATPDLRKLPIDSLGQYDIHQLQEVILSIDSRNSKEIGLIIGDSQNDHIVKIKPLEGKHRYLIPLSWMTTNAVSLKLQKGDRQYLNTFEAYIIEH